MALKIKAGVQFASNMAVEIEGDNVTEVVTAIHDFGTAIESNLAGKQEVETGEQQGRRGLIIPQAQVTGPIREPE